MPVHELFKPAKIKRTRLARGSVSLLIALQFLLVLLVLVGVQTTSQQLRRVTLDNLQSHANSQAYNMSDRLMQSFDLLYLHFERLWVDYPDAAIDPEVLTQALQQMQDKLSYVRSLSVMDVSGKLIISTNAANLGLRLELGTMQPPVSWRTVNQLRFGGAWYGRDFADGAPFIKGVPSWLDPGFMPLTLVMPDTPQWTFVIAINSDYFINELSQQDFSSLLTYRMLLDDGSLLFSTAADEQPSQQTLEPTELQQVLEHHSGTHHWRNPQGEEQVGAYHAAYNYPWLVCVSASTEQALQQWRQGNRMLWLLAGTFLAFMLLIGGLMTHRVSRTLGSKEQLLEHTSLAAKVFMHSNDSIAITNSDRQIIAVNPAYEKVTGFTASEILGQTPGHGQQDADGQEVYTQMWDSLAATGQWQGEIKRRHKNGQIISGQLQVNAIYDDTNQVLHYMGVFKDLSRLHASEAAVRKLSLAVEQSPSSVVMTTPEAAIEYANPQFLKSTGYSLDEVLGANPSILKSGQTPASTYAELWEKLAAGQVWNGEFLNRRKDGSLYYERCSISAVQDDKGKLTGYLAIKHDITAEKETEQAMRLAASVFANTGECIMICDASEHIVEVNPAFSRLTGYSAEQVLGQHPSMLNDGERNAEALTEMRKALASQGEWQGELWNKARNGRSFVSLGTVSQICDEAGKLTHYVSIFSDITESKRQEESLRQQAHFDALTGLPNRTLLSDRLKHAMARAVRHQHQLAICFMDLDGFKQVNDSLGHQAGDELLICIAQRLQSSLRADDTVARLGGDEFVLLLSPIKNLQECEQIVQRVLAIVAEPVNLSNGQQASVTGSLGLTLYPPDTNDINQLLRHADHAMYQAKQSGRNGYVVSNKARIGGL